MKFTQQFSETCRCHKELKVNWWNFPPYTIKSNESTPTGIIPNFLSSMVKEACSFCADYGYTNVTFRSLSSSTTEKLKNSSKSREKRSDDDEDDQGLELLIPVALSPGDKYFKGYNYISIVEVPGFILFKKNKGKEFLIKEVSSSLLDCWPYFVIYFSLVILAGFFIWMLVSDSKQ